MNRQIERSMWDSNIKQRNHSVMLRWLLWKNKLQNANKKQITLCLWVAFILNCFIISRNYIFKLSWLSQLCLVSRQGKEGYRSRPSLSLNAGRALSLCIFTSDNEKTLILWKDRTGISATFSKTKWLSWSCWSLEGFAVYNCSVTSILKPYSLCCEWCTSLSLSHSVLLPCSVLELIYMLLF